MKRKNTRAPDSELKRVTLRLPMQLYEQLEIRAKKNKRSLTAEIEILLDRFAGTVEQCVDFGMPAGPRPKAANQ